MKNILKDTKPQFVIMNGKITELENAKVSIMAPGFTFAINVFEGIRGYWNDEEKILYIFRIKDHLKRLNFSSKILDIENIFTDKELQNQIENIIRKNNVKENLYIRVQIYLDDWGTMFSKSPVGSSIISYKRPRSEGYYQGRNFTVSSWRRNSEDSSPPRVKTTANYFNGRLAGLEAIKAGYEGSIILNQDGCISEGPAGCIFLIRNGEFITPSKSSGILESITRDTVIKIIKNELELNITERSIGRTELYLADEIFYCGTAQEIVPINSIDKKIVGQGKPGMITKQIQSIYDKIVFGKKPEYKNWLTPIELS